MRLRATCGANQRSAVVLHDLSPIEGPKTHPPLPSKEPLDKPLARRVQSRAMKRLAGWLIPVAFGLVACGYIPGSAADPSVSPTPSPTEAALVLPAPAGPPDIPSPVAYNPWASPAPTLAPPTVDTAPAPAAYTASNPSIAVFCNLYFENGLALLVVAVKDRNSGQYVTDATVTARMVGTDAKYAAAPTTQFSGASADVDPNHLAGVPTYRFSFPFAVPPVQYDAQGNQLPSAYSTYRCKVTASWQGQTASF